MRHYQYLIIGGGMAASAAIRGIREVDANGSIGLISAEPDPPYVRPPLSKGLWQDSSLEQIWRDTEELAADLCLERIVQPLDRERKQDSTQLPDERRRQSTDDQTTMFT
jgi:NAD(P)H-nitrite reductase large subunit